MSMRSKFKVDIDVDGAAFSGLKGDAEIARILRDLAATIEATGNVGQVLYDADGNRVGRSFVTEEY